MAITIAQEKKSSFSLILLIIIAVILISSFFIWMKFFNKPTSAPPPVAAKTPEIKINFDVLTSPVLKDLQPFEDIKPIEGEIGRDNPFLAY